MSRMQVSRAHEASLPKCNAREYHIKWEHTGQQKFIAKKKKPIWHPVANIRVFLQR